MIVVRIELHSAVTGAVEEIGKMYITNVGGDAHSGNYQAKVLRRKVETLSNTAHEGGQFGAEPATRTAEVWGYPRLSANVWRLVLRALKGAFPEEKK